MAEEKKVEVKSQEKEKKDLFLVDELIKNLDWPEWQKAALWQYGGWKSGKSVDKKQFDTVCQSFQKKYGISYK
ncbi:MAG: hypothetical protein QXJ28_02760 [Candidatus Pacearchaeota archaeon]